MTTGTATAPASAAPVPAGQLSHRHILEILSGLMLGLFLAALDQTIVASAIAHHRRRSARLVAAREPGSPVGGVPDQQALALAASDPLADTGRPARRGGQPSAAQGAGLSTDVAEQDDGVSGRSESSTGRQWAVWGHVLRPDGAPQPDAALTLTDEAGTPEASVKPSTDLVCRPTQLPAPSQPSRRVLADWRVPELARNPAVRTAATLGAGLD